MEREIHPEPTPEELDALDEALARLLASSGVRTAFEGGPWRSATRSDWWREGVRENLLEDDY